MQHRVAGAAASDESGTAMAARVARRPSWLVGLALSAVAFGLHALALSRGDLAVVQPVIVSGIVFAVLIRAGLERQLPRRRTLVWLILTWAGLALFLLVRPPAATRGVHDTRALVLVITAAALSLALVIAARRSSKDRQRGLLFGAAAGLLFGIVAGLVKLVLAEAGHGWHAVLADWPLWSLVAVGGSAVALNQRAYQSTRLSVTAPVLNIVQVVVAITFGALVFDEDPGSSWLIITGEVIGLVLIGLGVWNLASDSGADGADPTEKRGRRVRSDPARHGRRRSPAAR